MKVNVLYIREEDLQFDLKDKLKEIDESQTDLFVVLQMKLAKIEFQPLINNLMEIRKEKSKVKLEEWIKLNFPSINNVQFYIHGREKVLTKNDMDLSDFDQLNYYYTNKEGKRFLLLMKDVFVFNKINSSLI